MDSLAEVILQNHRGLDLLFLQGGLCLALGEQCCFYVNNSGIIKQSLAQIRQRLEEREKQRQANLNWYESLFSWSPWLTTLLSALVGPLILVLLVLFIRPCLVKLLLQFINQRLSSIKLMVL